MLTVSDFELVGVLQCDFEDLDMIEFPTKRIHGRRAFLINFTIEIYMGEVVSKGHEIGKATIDFRQAEDMTFDYRRKHRTACSLRSIRYNYLESICRHCRELLGASGISSCSQHHQNVLDLTESKQNVVPIPPRSSCVAQSETS